MPRSPAARRPHVRADGAWDTYTCAQVMSGHVATVFLPRMVGLQGVEEAQQVLGELPARGFRPRKRIPGADTQNTCIVLFRGKMAHCRHPLNCHCAFLLNGKSACFNTQFKQGREYL